MRIAIDGSSLLWTCLLVGKDAEGVEVIHNDKPYTVNTAKYGYEFAVNSVIATMRNANCTPKDLIFVWEGLNSKSKRISINYTYKTSRGDRPAEAYAEFQTLKERMQTTFGKLGSLSITQEEAEGDDVLAWLAFNTEEDLIISTGDNDMSVLNGTNQYGAAITVVIKGVVGENKYGSWPCKYITVYKAMVGDAGDTIPGIRGFGKTAWEDFLKEFGEAGLAEMDRLARKGSLDELVPEMDKSKMIRRLVEGSTSFLNSYALARLYPEWVNTLTYPLEWVPGLIRGSTGDERLVEWESTTLLVTASTWDAFEVWILDAITENDWIALDIETSTPEESDGWIAAQNKREGSTTVDVIGSELTGMSLTFGKNMQHTVYISINHIDTDNVPKAKLQALIKSISLLGKSLVIQNCSFEGTVLYNEWGKDWKDNGFEGFLPNMLDTKIEASYVNENESLGLKKLSKQYFNYDQVEYKDITSIDGIDYKMCELSGEHVKDYGCDDTICTASLHNFFKLFMQLEHTWQIYLNVEIDAMYLHTQSFVHGVKCDVAKCKELEAIDEQTSKDAWIKLSKYLISQGWGGTVPPVYTETSVPADIKQAYLLYTGREMDTRDRKLEKLAAYAIDQGEKLFGELLLAKDFAGLTTLVQSKFEAKPEFNPGSPKQMSNLIYEVMKLPVRVFNPLTAIARKAGETTGTAKTDELAIAYALKLDATPEQKEVLEALRLIKMVATRNGLYYSTYPYFLSWKTGRLHSSHNQCATNTRRASSSGPNLQQLPKATKIDGQAARFREVLIPHRKDAVIVSMDFVSQEILLLAEWSHDPVLEEVFTGNPPKDMHSMTAVGIYNSQNSEKLTYEEFKAIVDNQSHELYKVCKKYRALGKAINFSGQYRVSAKKMASMLFVTEAEAQVMIDAKAEAFPVSEQWALDEMSAVKHTGTVKTLLGAVRHLRNQVTSSDKYESSKADRQALSYRIQGSAAEMTKLAEGRMWKEKLEQKFDCQIIAPVHDEIVASVAIKDLYSFLPVMHQCMIGDYANMQLPIRSSISFGRSFGQLIEIGDTPTQEAVSAGLVELAKLS